MTLKKHISMSLQTIPPNDNPEHRNLLKQIAFGMATGEYLMYVMTGGSPQTPSSGGGKRQQAKKIREWRRYLHNQGNPNVDLSSTEADMAAREIANQITKLYPFPFPFPAPEKMSLTHRHLQRMEEENRVFQVVSQRIQTALEQLNGHPYADDFLMPRASRRPFSM